MRIKMFISLLVVFNHKSRFNLNIYLYTIFLMQIFISPSPLWGQKKTANLVNYQDKMWPRNTIFLPERPSGMWLANFEKEGNWARGPRSGSRGEAPAGSPELRRFSSIKYLKTPLRCPENLQLTLVDYTKIYKF